MEGDNFFLSGYFLIKSLGLRKKIRKIADPENPDFNGFGRFFHLNFHPQQLISQMSAQLVMKMSGKI